MKTLSWVSIISVMIAVVLCVVAPAAFQLQVQGLDFTQYKGEKVSWNFSGEEDGLRVSVVPFCGDDHGRPGLQGLTSWAGAAPPSCWPSPPSPVRCYCSPPSEAWLPPAPSAGPTVCSPPSSPTPAGAPSCCYSPSSTIWLPPAPSAGPTDPPALSPSTSAGGPQCLQGPAARTGASPSPRWTLGAPPGPSCCCPPPSKIWLPPAPSAVLQSGLYHHQQP